MIPETNEFLRRIYLLIIIRLSLGLIFLTIYFTSYFRGTINPSILYPVYVYSICLLILTFLSGLLFRYFQNRLVIYGWSQLTFDVIFVTLLIYLSGGVLSPFAIFYIPIIIIASLLFGIRGGVITGAIAFLLYGALLDLQYYGYIDYPNFTKFPKKPDVEVFLHNLLINIAIFFITGLLSGFFVERWKIAETRLKTSLSNIRSMRSFHEKILNNIKTGVIVSNKEFDIVYANPYASEMLNLQISDFKGKNLKKLFPSVTHSVSREELEYFDPKTNAIKIMSYSIYPIEENKDNKGWVFLFQDLTKEKWMEKEIKEAERFSFAGKVASEIAHNIKNPLAVISGIAQMMLRQEPQNPTFNKLLEILAKEVQKIESTIKSFLILSKVTFSDQGSVRINLHDELKQLVDNFLNAKNLKNNYLLVLKNEIPANVFLNGNPSEFEIMIWNILENAVEAMPSGGNIEISATLESQKENPTVRIDIRDYGEGIKKEIADKIFEPFFTTKPKGTGIGLTIVNQIAKKLKGSVKCCPLDRGTLFSILLPVSIDK